MSVYPNQEPYPSDAFLVGQFHYEPERDIMEAALANHDWFGFGTNHGPGSLAGFTTDDLPEGVVNFYYTEERVDDRVAALIQDSSSISWSYDDGAGALTGSVIASGVDHGGLGGLLDDDHTQYSLVDGTRPFTGAVSIHGSSDTSQFTIKGHSTQTANLQEWQNSSGVAQTVITSTGNLDLISTEQRIYNTYTSPSEYDRASMRWDSNVFKIATEASSSGNASGRSIDIKAGDGYGVSAVGGSINLTAGTSKSASPQFQSGSIAIKAGSCAGRLVWGGNVLIEGGSNTGVYGYGTAAAGGKVTIKTGTPRGDTFGPALEAEPLELIGGTGGSKTQTGTAGKGSSIVLNAGTGGEATGTSSTGGEGGDIILTAGTGGTGATANGAEGTIQLKGGNVSIDNELTVAGDLTVSGTSPRSLQVYNTYTDASNYERALFDWQTTANTLRIGTEALGTGTVRPIEIQGAGTTILGDASTDVPLTVKGASGQTANLLELKDSTLKNRLTVSADGNLITLGRTDYQAWQGLHDTCTITTGVGGGNSTTACDLVIRPASDSLLADTYIYAGYRISNGGGSGNITIGQEDFVGNASPAGMGTVTIRTGSMATQSGGSFDGGTLAITTGGGGGFGSIGTPAGAGGAINVTLGNGKASSVASVIAGAGGSFTLTAGDGAVASGTTSTGGDGGSIVLTAGSKGTGTSADGADGEIQLNAVQDNAKLSNTPSGSVGLAIATVAYVNDSVATVYESVATTTTITERSGKVVEQTASEITTSLWATPTAGHTLTILNRSGGQTTISGNGKNIEGSATFVMNDNESLTFIYNGTQWRVHD